MKTSPLADLRKGNMVTLLKLSVALPFICLLAQCKSQDETLPAQAFGRLGDMCDGDFPCDRDANLACHDEICDCRMPEIMFYDDEALQCRVKAGKRCKFMMEHREAEKPERHDERITMPCTSNATCAEDGVCRCNPYFYKDSHDKCLEKKALGMPCDRNLECDADAGLVCWRNMCGCNPFVSRVPAGYGPKNSCVGIPGGPCVQGECELNSKCMRGGCICEDGFQLDHQQRRCKGLFDQPCADSSFCGAQFDCLDFRCKCKGPNQVFDDSLQKCFSIVGETCVVDGDCVPHAQCVPRGSVGSFCQCQDGFSEFGPGFCRNGYGSVCLQRTEERAYLIEKESLLASSLTDLQRPTPENLRRTDSLVLIKIGVTGCDENRKLRCRKGKCLCKDGVEMYDEKWGKCVGLAGTLCSVYENHGCVDNADCTPVLNLRHVGLGRCTCRNNFSMGTQRQCVAKSSY